MFTKAHILFIFLTFGFFLLPNVNYACDIAKQNSCCATEQIEKSAKKDCCKKSSEQENNSCGGKCGHSNCTSSAPVNFSLLSFFEIEFKNNNIDFSTEELNFYYSKTFISSGFTSVWLPPKIK